MEKAMLAKDLPSDTVAAKGFLFSRNSFICVMVRVRVDSSSRGDILSIDTKMIFTIEKNDDMAKKKAMASRYIALGLLFKSRPP